MSKWNFKMLKKILSKTLLTSFSTRRMSRNHSRLSMKTTMMTKFISFMKRMSRNSTKITFLPLLPLSKLYLLKISDLTQKADLSRRSVFRIHSKTTSHTRNYYHDLQNYLILFMTTTSTVWRIRKGRNRSIRKTS
jgi:hypothetical protein